MAVGTLVAGTTSGSTGGTLNPTQPASIATDDIIILGAIFANDGTGTVPTAITWPTGLGFVEGDSAAVMDSSGNVRGIAGWAWKRAAGGESGTVSISSNGTVGATSSAVAQAWKLPGTVTSGDFWEDKTFVNPNQTTTVDWPPVTMARSSGGASIGIFLNSDNISLSASTDWTRTSVNGTSQGIDAEVDSFQNIPGATGTYDPADKTITAGTSLGWALFHIMATDTAGGGGSPQDVPATGLASSSAFGTPTIDAGAITVEATGLASASAFGTATVLAGGTTVQPTGLDSASAFGTPEAAQSIEALGLGSSSAFGTPTVAVGNTNVAATGLGSASQFGNPATDGGDAPTFSPAIHGGRHPR